VGNQRSFYDRQFIDKVQAKVARDPHRFEVSGEQPL
jgi:hypothetical protein